MSSNLLAHARVSAPGATPARWSFVLHGVLGQGSNLRTLAKAVAARRPEWGFVLVDLPGHGQSPPIAEPRTVETAAGALVRLAVAIEPGLGAPIAGVIGHSLGGKIALAYASACARGLEGRRALDELWVLDSSLESHAGARFGVATRVIAMLRALPPSFASRDEFLVTVRGQGFSAGTAEWLAMNVRVVPGDPNRYVFRLDLEAIEALLGDYFARSFMADLAARSLAAHAHVVVGGKSETVPPPVQAELAELAAQGIVNLHVMPNAGHWLHTDDPDGLVELIATRLS